MAEYIPPNKLLRLAEKATTKRQIWEADWHIQTYLECVKEGEVDVPSKIELEKLKEARKKISKGVKVYENGIERVFNRTVGEVTAYFGIRKDEYLPPELSLNPLDRTATSYASFAPMRFLKPEYAAKLTKENKSGVVFLSSATFDSVESNASHEVGHSVRDVFAPQEDGRSFTSEFFAYSAQMPYTEFDGVLRSIDNPNLLYLLAIHTHHFNKDKIKERNRIEKQHMDVVANSLANVAFLTGDIKKWLKDGLIRRSTEDVESVLNEYLEKVSVVDNKTEKEYTRLLTRI